MRRTSLLHGVGAALVGMAASAGTVLAMNIETVPVGNLGNAADTRYASFGYGRVDYAYSIGKYEVTAGQYTAFLNAVAKTDTYGLYNPNMADTSYGSGISRSGSAGSYTYSVDAAFVNRPVNYFSWGDAARFTNWLHNGQPTGTQGLSTTEDGAYFLNGATSAAALGAVTRKTNWKWAITSWNEWYKAAYHKNDGVTGNYWDYPTGTNSTPGRDMSEATNPGNNANYRAGTQLPTPYPIDPPRYTTVVGEFQLSDSPYGTFDQGGNLAEWTDAPAGDYRRLAGGAYYSDPSSLRPTYGDAIYTTSEFLYIGFRVVAVPEPATLALLAIGAGLLARRRCFRGF